MYRYCYTSFFATELCVAFNYLTKLRTGKSSGYQTTLFLFPFWRQINLVLNLQRLFAKFCFQVLNTLC